MDLFVESIIDIYFIDQILIIKIKKKCALVKYTENNIKNFKQIIHLIHYFFLDFMTAHLAENKTNKYLILSNSS